MSGGRADFPRGWDTIICPYILTRDRWLCHWCGTPLRRPGNASVDHVVPRIEGGSHHPSNLVASCKSCNSSRGWHHTNSRRGRSSRTRTKRTWKRTPTTPSGPSGVLA